MSSSSSATSAKLVISLLIVFNVTRFCEATITVGITGVTTTWTPFVRSPDETCDMASFIFAGTELHRSPSAAVATEETRAKATATEEVPPEVTEDSDWETTFAAGVYESKKAVEADNVDVSSWVSDSISGAAVPARMLKAEVYLQAAEKATTETKIWKEKTAERALRIYYHAKWLAERNYARAAEYRYREAAHLARTSRRSVLASHSLARLGYFLVHWKRQDEAQVVLEESMKINSKSNPLAPYLHGVLERKVAGGDVDRLREAEEFIIKAGEQPSEELEAERGRLIEEISYWREAEADSRHCSATNDVAYVLICFFGHVIAFLKSALFK